VRACPACNGQWVLEPVLAEMVMAMLPAGVLGRLSLDPRAQRETQSACPSCGVAMESVEMHGIDLERCSKGHGVWFDPQELQAGLLRYATHPSESQLVDEAPTLPLPEPAPTWRYQPVDPADLLPEPPARPAPDEPWTAPRKVPEPAPAPWAESSIKANDDNSPLSKVIARMKAGRTFSVGGQRCYEEYGWDANTQQLYHYSRDEDCQHEGRVALTEQQLLDAITSSPSMFE
jgi:Zn-finger nucleic acid-binding protein